jgi:tripartite ATP-independent transporter DctM subunit
MGYVLAESKTADRLVKAAQAWIGWIPGGLAIATILVCAMFTTVTGASGVTIVAVGGLMMPALLKEGYKDKFALGLVTGTGSIGLLFPPALPLIIYGIVYGLTAQAAAASGTGEIKTVDFTLDKFLKAGILPGAVLCGAFMIYAVYVAIRDKVPREKFYFKPAMIAFLKALPELAIPIVMVGFLAKGLQIAEASVLTVLYVLIIECLIYRDVKLRQLPHVVRESMKLVGAIFILIVAATALTNYFVTADVPTKMTNWMLENIHSKYVFLIALNIMLLAVGCVMDIFSALLVVVPLIALAATKFGIDPNHLGVIFLLNLEVGYVHPPVGLNLFISAFRFKRPMVDLYWAIIPFVVIMLITLVIVTYVPGLTLVHSNTEEETPAATGGAGGDGGVAAKPNITIRLPNGKEMKDCDDPEIKADPVNSQTCPKMFEEYAKCASMQDELEKVDCQDKAVHIFYDEPEGDGGAPGGAPTPTPASAPGSAPAPASAPGSGPASQPASAPAP